MEKRCESCERRFIPHPAVRHQEYCSDPECQKTRKRKWQKEKLAGDSDYRANQAEAQRQWKKEEKGSHRNASVSRALFIREILRSARSYAMKESWTSRYGIGASSIPQERSVKSVRS